jgi:putative phage-type endonuclease
MEQRSAEWFSARKGRVTGSIVGGILGLSPFMTRDDVMRSLVRDWHDSESEFTGNIATQWGEFHESEAVMAFIEETGLNVQNCGFFPHLDWLGASPDGLVGDDAIIEIKCPFSLRDGGDHKSIADLPHYHAQMQIEMLCAERVKAYFFQWAPHATQLEVVRRDEGWLDDNIPVLFAFYEEFLKERENPAEHLAPKRVEINTNRAVHLISEYEDLQEAEDRAKERKKEVLAELVEITKGKNALVAGRKLTKVEREGSISYAKAIKELAPDADLEKWRGKPTEYWRLG